MKFLTKNIEIEVKIAKQSPIYRRNLILKLIFDRKKVLVNMPLDCASRKIGLYWVDEKKGKESVTEFERISFNGSTSVVKCLNSYIYSQYLKSILFI